ncbi:gp176 [Bacillus phage G]|uniref:Gp176 n=1 Tax=Bacillus phage G TaxID=2884420 RepID=G3MBP2_9CAUD|nr:gp176 [Bacillus phage G]AEO93436.1 gp176 [Bacillus phage G]
MRSRKITIENITGKRIDGIITNQPIELTDQQLSAIAEGVLQVLYNMGVYSGVEFNYDLKLDDGTKFYVHGTDVTVLPANQDSYTRRIRNNSQVVSKQDKKDDDFLREMEKMERN